MADELEKINEIFRVHDDPADADASDRETGNAEKQRTTPLKAMDRLLIDADGDQARNYTGDEESERDYRPCGRAMSRAPAVSAG